MAFETSQSVQQLPAEVKAQAVEAARPAAKLMESATAHRHEAPTAGSDHAGGKEALRHNQSSPEKSQAALSPTDSNKGHAHQRGGMER
jgi:hypothetical protein